MELFNKVSEKETRPFLDLAEHKLKGPLGAARWNLELLIGELTDPELKTSAEDVYKLIVHEVSFIVDFFIIEKIRESRLQDNRSKVKLNEIVEEILKELDKEIVSRKINIKKQLNSIEIEADSNLIKKSIFNLVSNAIKYNKVGGDLEVNVSEENGEVLIEVKDTGIGIPEEEHSRVGELFYRASNAGPTGEVGSGVGIAFIRAMLTGWGGSLTFESKENSGSKFMLKLPKILLKQPFTL